MKHNGQDLWSTEGRGPHDREMLAGMAVAIDKVANAKLHQTPEYSFAVDGIGEKRIVLDENYNEVEERDHFVMTNINEIVDTAGLEWVEFAAFENGAWVFKDYPLHEYIEGYHWITGHLMNIGRLITGFRSAHFVRGFIMGCNACGVDFRDVVYGKPFKVAFDGTVTYYDIVGYPMVNPPDLPTQV